MKSVFEDQKYCELHIFQYFLDLPLMFSHLSTSACLKIILFLTIMLLWWFLSGETNGNHLIGHVSLGLITHHVLLGVLDLLLLLLTAWWTVRTALSLTKPINAPFQSLGWAGKSLKNWRCHLWLHLRCFITLRTKHYSKFTSRHV